MKKNTRYALIAATILANIFSSCQKQNDFRGPVINAKSNAVAQQEKAATPGATVPSSSMRGSLTYAACDRIANIYDPQPGNYTLAMSSGTSYKKFGIPLLGILDFIHVDMISFEFSGLYANAANTIKLYRVRRQDGNYLTFHLNLDYSSKLNPGQGEELQLWIFNDLGNNKYNLILPKYGTTCWLARTYEEKPGYKIGVVASDQTIYTGSTAIYIHPAGI